MKIEKKEKSKEPTASREQIKQFNETCILIGKDWRIYDKSLINKYGPSPIKNKNNEREIK